MKYHILLAAAILGLAGCSSGDQTANHVFDAIQDTDFIKKATPVSCDLESKVKAISFREKCWTRDISAGEIDMIGEEGVALGLAVQKALNLQSEIIETDRFGYVLLRAETKGECAHYIQTHISPVQDLIEPYTLQISIGVTKKPFCGELELGTAS